MPTDLPPFLQGKQAFLAGKPIDDNPYQEGIVQGDHYPGKNRNWEDGWLFEQKLKAHTQQQAQQQQ